MSTTDQTQPLEAVGTHDFSPAERVPTAQSQHPLYLTLSQQSTLSLPDPFPQATAGNQIPPGERARTYAQRRGENTEQTEPRPRPKGFARLFSAFKHPKSSSRESSTFGKWTVSYGAGTKTGRDSVYGGLM